MTEELKAIWKCVDRISDFDLADEIESSKVREYLDKNKFIIPEEDWDEIQTRGYDIPLMMYDTDQEHLEDTEWWEVIYNSLLEQGFKKDLKDNMVLTEFWRGFQPGTTYDEITRDMVLS